MDFDKYLDTIASSEPAAWVFVSGSLYLSALSQVSSTEGGEQHKWLEAASPHYLHTYRPNMTIQMAFGLRDDDEREFNEEWATRFPNRDAYKATLDFLFAGTLVYRATLVGVDGAACHLPMPDQKTHAVPRRLSAIARLLFGLHHSTGSYDDFLDRARLHEDDQPWPRPGW